MLVRKVLHVTPWVVISSDVPKPYIKPIIRKYVTQTLSCRVHDPGGSVCQETMLQENNLFAAIFTFFTSPPRNPLQSKNKAILCCHVMFLEGISSACYYLSLMKERKWKEIETWEKRPHIIVKNLYHSTGWRESGKGNRIVWKGTELTNKRLRAMWAHVTAVPWCKQSRYACAHHITQAGIGQTVQWSRNSSNLRQNHIELSQFSLIQIISFFSSAIFALTFAQAHS